MLLVVLGHCVLLFYFSTGKDALCIIFKYDHPAATGMFGLGLVNGLMFSRIAGCGHRDVYYSRETAASIIKMRN